MDTHTHLLYIVHGPISAALVVSSVLKMKTYIWHFVSPPDCPLKRCKNVLNVPAAGWRLAAFGLISDFRQLY